MINATFAVTMKKLLTVILLVMAGMLTWAQSVQKADQLFQSGEWQAAGEQYAQLLKRQPRSALYLYRYARCQQELGNTAEAIHYFEIAGDKYALRNLFLANLYAEQYRFDEAIQLYEIYLNQIDATHERYESTQQKLTYARKGSKLLNRVADIAVIDSVTLPKSRFLTAYQLTVQSGKIIGRKDLFSYLTERGDRQVMTVRTDSTFSLAMSEKLLNEWSEPRLLPAGVNSEQNENYPFMMSDGITLYFASDRTEGLGGYDIYITRHQIETDTWLAAENLGFPFNSCRNDYMYAVDETRGIGFFATDRHTADDSVRVYSFKIEEPAKLLKNESDDYIRLVAQLKAYRHEATQPAEDSSEIEGGESNDEHFRLVISDGLVYTDWHDFRSIDAKAMYQTWQEGEDNIAEEKHSLELNRRRYAQSSEQEKSVLKGIILTQEKTILTLEHEQKELLKKIRRQELEKIH